LKKDCGILLPVEETMKKLCAESNIKIGDGIR